MPILVGIVTPPPPPPPPPPPLPDTSTPPTPPLPGSGRAACLEVYWIAPDNTAWHLTSSDSPGAHITGDGLQGMGPVDPGVLNDPQFGSGARVRGVRVPPKSLTVPLMIDAPDADSFVEYRRALTTAFTATKRLGPGRLLFVRPDGTSRSVGAYYDGGLDPALGLNFDFRHIFAAVGLFAPDPYFRSEVRETRGGAYEVPRDYLNPYMTVSAAQTLGELTVDYHDGDVESWPRWTFTPPWTRLEIRNRTTGKGFVVSAGSTETTLTVDTDPTAPRVVASDGTNWMPYLDWPGATLFPLEPGENALTVQMDGAAPGSSWEMSFYRRYETA